MFYNIKDNPNSGYLIEEYVTALGTENICSKYFHLFSMIEFIELNYGEILGNIQLIPNNDIDTIVHLLNENEVLQEETKDMVVSGVKQRLKQFTILGRNKSILEILKRLGIDSIEYGMEQVPLTEAKIRDYTKARNRLFHGNLTEHLPRLVAELLSLGLKIIEGVSKQELFPDEIQLVESTNQ